MIHLNIKSVLMLHLNLFSIFVAHISFSDLHIFPHQSTVVVFFLLQNTPHAEGTLGMWLVKQYKYIGIVAVNLINASIFPYSLICYLQASSNDASEFIPYNSLVLCDVRLLSTLCSLTLPGATHIHLFIYAYVYCVHCASHTRSVVRNLL